MNYEVSYAGESHDCETREEAIELARELSQQNHGNVVVEDEDNVERMTYRNGALEQYLHDTRRRR